VRVSMAGTLPAAPTLGTMSTSGSRRSLQVIEVPAGAEAVPALWDPLDVALGGGPPIALVPQTSSASAPAFTESIRSAIQPSSPVDEDTAVVLSTSGSTGRPRGVALSASALTSLSAQVNELAGGEPAWVLAIPPTSIGGLNVLIRARSTGLAPVAVSSIGGAERFTSAGFHEAVTRARESDRPVAVSLVPAQLPRLLSGGEGREALAMCSLILVGGAALAPQAARDCADAGIEVTSTYGMTETSGGCVLNGSPLAGVRVRIDDQDERIWLSGSMLASGYRDANNEAFVDGWLRTNDRGRWLDGRLQVLGRLDDVVAVRGMNVDLLAVEDRLRAHPLIDDAIVVAVPDSGGDVTVHAITTGEDVGAQAARAWVVELLGEPAGPRAVHSVSSFDYTPSGKIDRHATARRLGLDPTSSDDLDEDLT